MTDDLGRAERQALEIEALGNEIVTRLPAALEMLRQYKRGYPTGSEASGDGTSRTEALGIAPPDAIDREQRELSHSLDRALKALNVVYNITVRYQPPRRDRKPGQPSTTPADEGWCCSCIRDGGYLEPAAAGRYARHCRFCGEWSAMHGADPPLEIVRARHEGRRITTAMADRALAGRRAG